uniref:Uncharacterized protein n=1 Tax=Anolis carolinensis TaxID=28377 RepID=A0A803TXW7_ANOCA
YKVLSNLTGIPEAGNGEVKIAVKAGNIWADSSPRPHWTWLPRDTRVPLGPRGPCQSWHPWEPHETSFSLGARWALQPLGPWQASLPRNPWLSHKTTGPLIPTHAW